MEILNALHFEWIDLILALITAGTGYSFARLQHRYDISIAEYQARIEEAKAEQARAAAQETEIRLGAMRSARNEALKRRESA